MGAQGDEWELEGEEEGENDLKIVFGTKLDRFDFCSQVSTSSSFQLGFLFKLAAKKGKRQ